MLHHTFYHISVQKLTINKMILESVWYETATQTAAFVPLKIHNVSKRVIPNATDLENDIEVESQVKDTGGSPRWKVRRAARKKRATRLAATCG